MSYTVFVDGQEGTTGLKIFEYLAKVSDIEILKIDSDKKKNPKERSKFLNEADIVFLCLPDSAAKESIELVKNDKARIINAGTAFRTDQNWVFGLPELKN
jgi:N-acetyl-gamma-glutamyl-phosphate reductase